MTMVASGTISLGGSATSGGLNQSVNVELGQAPNANVSLNDTNVRALANVPSGTISLGSMYGKKGPIQINLELPTDFEPSRSNYNIYTAALAANPAVANTPAHVTLTIDSSLTLYGVQYSPALATGNSWQPGSTITIINNGTIVGYGGDNGFPDSYPQGVNGNGLNGGDGGDAVSATWATSFTNNGIVAGGGGQGGFGGNSNALATNANHRGVGGVGGIGRGGLATSSTSGGSGLGPVTGSGSSGFGEAAHYTTTTPPPDTGQFATSNAGNSATVTLTAQAGTAGGGRSGGGWGCPGGSWSISGRGRDASGTLNSIGGQGGAAGRALTGVSFVNGGQGIINGSVYGHQI